MASYHCHFKPISRAAGRSATAAAAYRAGARIEDERTGLVHDYRRKGGVEHSQILLPSGAPEWAGDRAQLWNRVEGAERRKDSKVAREVELGLPAELNQQQRMALALDFAQELVARHGCAVDVAIHGPNREGDQRNHHAHVLMSTRRLAPEGFTEKTIELDDRRQSSGEVRRWRKRWEDLQNERLAAHGATARVDHRSLAEQGIERDPQVHLGPAATEIERREKRQAKESGKPLRRLSRRREMEWERRRERGRRREVAAMTNPQITKRLDGLRMSPMEAANRSGVVTGLRRSADAATRRVGVARSDLAKAQDRERHWRRRHRVRAYLVDKTGLRKPPEIKAREAAEARVKEAAKEAKAKEARWQGAKRQVESKHERQTKQDQPYLQALQAEAEIRKIDRTLEREERHLRPTRTRSRSQARGDDYDIDL